MRVLHLTLHRQWFDMIYSGQKPEEYRDITEYWKPRLQGRHYDAVCFRNGYQRNAPRFTIELIDITIGIGKSDWGAPTDKQVYILRLGSILIA